VEFKGFDKDTKACHFVTEPYKTKFNGVAADGKDVSGVVCKSYFGNKRIALNSAQ